MDWLVNEKVFETWVAIFQGNNTRHKIAEVTGAGTDRIGSSKNPQPILVKRLDLLESKKLIVVKQNKNYDSFLMIPKYTYSISEDWFKESILIWMIIANNYIATNSTEAQAKKALMDFIKKKKLKSFYAMFNDFPHWLAINAQDYFPERQADNFKFAVIATIPTTPFAKYQLSSMEKKLLKKWPRINRFYEGLSYPKNVLAKVKLMDDSNC